MFRKSPKEQVFNKFLIIKNAKLKLIYNQYRQLYLNKLKLYEEIFNLKSI